MGVAVVTGAAVRLGKAMALRLAEEGYDIGLHYGRSRDRAEDVADVIRGMGRKVHLHSADMNDEAAAHGLVPDVAANLGPVTVLINSASIFEDDAPLDVTRDGWDRHMMINLRAPFIQIQQLARQLPDSEEGFVLNMIDHRVINTSPDYISYTTSKVALWGLTQQLAKAMAPRLRINAIGPGPAMPAPGATQEMFEELCEAMPLQRGSSPGEIADMMAFLLKTKSMTGQMLCADGGQHLGWLNPELAARNARLRGS